MRANAVKATLVPRWIFRDASTAGVCGTAMLLDVSWCGGLSEANKIATMAEAHQLPVAPHNCTGPVVLAASIPPINVPNALIHETVRGLYTG